MSKWVLITGASAGIGRDLALVFAENNFDLVLLARNQPALETLAAECRQRFAVRAEVLPADLSEPGAAARIHAELATRSINIEVLVNNAGFGNHGQFHSMDMQKELALIQVNITALTELTRLFLPNMVAQNSGRILNVASVAAFVPGPYLATYYASKSYVLSFSLALAYELRTTNVTVTTLCPGPTRTEFQRRAGISEANMPGRSSMDSMRVARDGFAGLMRGKRIVVPGLWNKITVFATRFLPRGFLAKLAGNLNEHRGK